MKGRINLDLKYLRKAKNEYEGGKSLEEVAKIFGISRAKLSRQFKINGISIRSGSAARKSGSTIPLELQNDILALNMQRIPLLEICKITNVSYGRLHSFLKSKDALWGRRRSDLNTEEVERLYKVGKTVEELAEHYEVNWKTIRKILDDQKVQMRKFEDYKDQIDNLENIYKDLINNKKSTAKVASELGVSKFVLRERLKENGYVLRKKEDEQIVVNLERYPDFDYNFFKKNNAKSNYWAGFIAADGAIMGEDGKKLRLAISLSEKDREHLENLQSLLNHGKIRFSDMSKYRGVVNGREVVGKRMASFSISSTPLCQGLLEKGITQNKTYNLKVTPRLALCKHFWRGFFDGDGSLSKLRNSKGNISTVLSMGSASEEIIKDFKFFCKNIGITKFKYTVRTYKKPFYVFYLSGERARYLARHLYKNAPKKARLERKYEIAKSWMDWEDTKPKSKI